jgi:hypothetical protein
LCAPAMQTLLVCPETCISAVVLGTGNNPPRMPTPSQAHTCVT